MLTKLFLAVEPEVTDDDYELANEGYPERRGCQWATLEAVLEVPLRCVRENALWTYPVWCSCASDHDADRTDHLRERKGGAHVQTRERLQENETETDTLDGIENTEPQPEADTKVWSCVACPRDVKRKR